MVSKSKSTNGLGDLDGRLSAHIFPRAMPVDCADPWFTQQN